VVAGAVRSGMERRLLIQTAKASKRYEGRTVEQTQTQKSTPDSLGIYLREIRRIPLLTAKEESDLARRGRAGDHAALDDLVRRNLRFVVSIAKQYVGSGVPLEDLINEGNVGLIRAAERFDVDRGYRFISYAVWWIKQAILQHLGEQSRTVRLPLNKTTALVRVTRAGQRLGQQLGREPSAEELAAFLHLKPEEVERVLSMPTKQFSIDDPIEGQDNDFHVDTLSDESSPMPDEAAEEISRSEDIETALKSLNPREGDILRRYFGLGGEEPHTLEEIGAHYQLTRERVRQIRDRAISRLRTSPSTAALHDYSTN
jgi:RNA polymerase primary sigma factor